MRNTRGRLLVGLALVAALAAGCRKKKPAVPVAVKGQVRRADGKPLPKLLVTFYPQDEGNKHGRAPSWPLDAEGKFSGDALPGRYAATLSLIAEGTGPAGGPAGHGAVANPLPPEYAAYTRTDSTPWKDVTVPEGGTDSLGLTVQ